MNEILEDILHETNSGIELIVEADRFYDAFNELPESVRGNPIAEALQELALGKAVNMVTIKEEAHRWLDYFNIQYNIPLENPRIIHMRKINP